MNQFKKVQVVMLPHNSINTTITKYLPDTLSLNSNVLAPHTNQHLYILSDDKIRENDYFLADHRISIYFNNGVPNWVLCKCTKIKNGWIYCNEIPNEGHNGDWCKKVIATTDGKLQNHIKSEVIGQKLSVIYKILPQIPQQFIEKYIEKYNDGKRIKDVLVEYENKFGESTSKVLGSTPNDDIIRIKDREWIGLFPKINPKDNTITVKKAKESWNYEEIRNLFSKLQYDMAQQVIKNQEKRIVPLEWLEENL